VEAFQAVIGERFRPALDTLVTAFEYAADSQMDRWQFAIDLSELKASGATLADLRWLILRGFAEHARETTIPGDAERSFRKLLPTAFPEGTCFVLSQAGASNFRMPADASQHIHSMVPKQATALAPRKEQVRPDSRLTPEWDTVRRELRLGGHVIKRYRVPAPNQELILTAFQESGWPEFIDDPLPPLPNQDCKGRLQGTIKALNRKHLSRGIRFHGNGNGQQISWHAFVASKHNRPSRRRS